MTTKEAKLGHFAGGAWQHGGEDQGDERRSPRTRATVAQLLDKWLEVLDVDPSTRRGYEGYMRKHIRPLLGSLSLTRLDVETLPRWSGSTGK